MDCGKRCGLCNIPHNFPGACFDKSNICLFCKQYKKESIDYKGIEELKIKIHKILLKNPKRKYDCAIGFSGGKDSSYLLHFAKNVLGLNVLAVTITSDFTPEDTRDNIANIPKLLDIDSVKIINRDLNYCSRKCVRAWAKNPSPQMLLTFCSRCRYSLKKFLPNYVKKNHIPILLVGDMREEEISYRTDILALYPNKPTFLSKLLGYLKQLIKNPYFLLSPKCVLMNLKEFFVCNRNDNNSKNPIIIKPFLDYIEVKDENVTEALKELG
jgi:tRNA(Ile)-lysidine synthase TilS/MesJ